MKRSTQNHRVRMSRAIAILTAAQLDATKGGAPPVALTPVPWPPGPTVHRNTIILED